MPVEGEFALHLLQWQTTNGRHDLPWQQDRDPYRVWLSEIMLQQTQVETVRGYFCRFLQQFPDLASLAQADADAVLALWSGLGYYSRARNLHRCAVTLMQSFGGEFPHSAAVLETLPGIGRSTAAAIASICFGERVAILDGNVRRVLARYLGFDADLSKAANVQQLWGLAQTLLPASDLSRTMPRYTQAVMDLGAIVCRSTQPNCSQCPLSHACAAYRDGRQSALPVKLRRNRRRTEAWWLLWAARPTGEVWLEKRPQKGIWAGLYCFPVWMDGDEVDARLQLLGAQGVQQMPVQVHALTHIDLHLHPVKMTFPPGQPAGAKGTGDWRQPDAWLRSGLPAPVRRMLSGAGAPLAAPG